MSSIRALTNTKYGEIEMALEVQDGNSKHQGIIQEGLFKIAKL